MIGREPNLENWFSGRLDARRRAEFEQRRQHDAQARNEYDKLFRFLRALDEDTEVSPLELELVESRLFSESQASPLGAPESRTRPVLWAAALALLATGFLLVLWPSFSEPGTSEGRQGRGIAYVPPQAHLGVGQGLVARGGLPGHGLAVEFFCAAPAQPILDGSCAVNRDLSFAFKVEGEQRRGVDPNASLSLFGIDQSGELKYYFPTPVDHELPTTRSQRWTAIEHSVRLDVNHKPGRVRMFALWSPEPPLVQDIESFHQALIASEDLGPGEAWTERMPHDLLARLCGPTDECRSAQSELTITPAED
jgi:hypothetical protein